MKNKEFGKQPQREKTAKFKAVLRNRTNGAMSNNDLESIIRSVSPDRQYAIYVHSDSDSFCQAITLSHSDDGCDQGKKILGNFTFGNRYEYGCDSPAQYQECDRTAAAVIIRGASERTTHEIHIFVPDNIEGRREPNG